MEQVEGNTSRQCGSQPGGFFASRCRCQVGRSQGRGPAGNVRVVPSWVISIPRPEHWELEVGAGAVQTS